MSEKCNCQFCALYELRKKALESNDIEFIKKAVEQFSDYWMNADHDRSYYKSIIDGSWPQSEEILTYNLTKKHFYSLIDKWEEETCLSSRIEVKHPYFIEMKNMKGEASISWVLERIRQKKSWILVLLTIWIDKKDYPTTDDMAGNLNKLTDAWLQWGIENKFIKK